MCVLILENNICMNNNQTILQCCKFFIGIFLFFVILFSFLSVFTSRVHAFSMDEESISELNVSMEIFSDRSIFVEETIRYNFGTNQKRGIVRSIPITKVPGSIKDIQIDNIQVFDQNRNPHTFEIMQGVGAIDIRIGDEFIYRTGEQIYTIQYQVKNAIGLFADFDELYWNAIGHDWDVPIYSSRVRVVIPQNLADENITPQIFCGYERMVEVCASHRIMYTQNQTMVTFETYSDYILGEFKGITVAVSFPKNIVNDFSLWEKFLIYSIPLLKVLVPILFVLYVYRNKIKFIFARRRYFKSHPIIAEYETGDLNVLTSSLILKGYVARNAVVGHIFSLVIQGYMELYKQNNETYAFKQTDKPLSGLSDYDKAIINQLVTPNYNTQTQHNWLSTVSLTRATEQELQIWARNRQSQSQTNKDALKHLDVFSSAKGGLWGLFLFLAVNPGVFVWIILGQTAGFIFSFTMVLCAVADIVFPNRIHTLGVEGFNIERKILGIKKYIRVAEKDRIRFHSDPQNNLSFFESLLPFAILFKLEKKWIKEFEKLEVAQPVWMRGVDMNHSSFMHAVFDTQRSIQQTVSIFQPKSSSGGRSSSFSRSSSGSFSGSSGGGGGGGGGRSW